VFVIRLTVVRLRLFQPRNACHQQGCRLIRDS
jgi:hypothetical protein